MRKLFCALLLLLPFALFGATTTPITLFSPESCYSFYAGPNTGTYPTSTGVPTFRRLVTADFTGASVIMPVANGGTGVSTLPYTAQTASPFNTFFGQIGATTSGAGSNSLFGYHAGNVLSSGSNNCVFGQGALLAGTSTGGNTAIGTLALTALVTDGNNVAVGFSALNSQTAGSNNTAIGAAAGNGTTTGQNNVFVGYKAGFNQTTDSNAFYVDNQDRGSAAADKTKALLYGTFDAAPTSQALTVNGNLTVAQSWINVNSGANLGINLQGSSSGNCRLETAAAAGTATVFRFPPNMGTNNYVLTSNGSGITSWGTVNDAVLSANVPLLNAANTYTANQSFNVGASGLVIGNNAGTTSVCFGSLAIANPNFYSDGNYFVINSKSGSPLYLQFDSNSSINACHGGGNFGVDCTASERLEVNGNAKVDSNLLVGGSVSKLTGVSTAGGLGVPGIFAQGRVVAKTNALSGTLATFTPAADGGFEISGNVLVTTATVLAMSMTCTYTDESSASRTQSMLFLLSNATTASSISTANTYVGIPLHIRAKGGTAITIQTAGTVTTCVYNAEAKIVQTNN